MPERSVREDAMVRGLDIFRDYFRDYQDHYVLIGGAACDVLMADAGLEFRATKDLDIVLCVEVLNAEFGQHFWRFIEEGGYRQREMGSGDKEYYRFVEPAEQTFPIMIELFSRRPDEIELFGEAHLTPVPVDEDISSLSAILLDDDYYQCLLEGKQVIDGICLLKPEYILAFKVRAYLDMKSQPAGTTWATDGKIRKHRADIFRLFGLLSSDLTVVAPEAVKEDLRDFIAVMQSDKTLEIRDLGIRSRTLDEVLGSLRNIFQLENG